MTSAIAASSPASRAGWPTLGRPGGGLGNAGGTIHRVGSAAGVSRRPCTGTETDF
jgi:hypothetical protein